MFKEKLLVEFEIKAKEIGFDDFAITDLNDFQFHTKKMQDFIKKNYHGEMNWLKEKIDIRKNPKNIWKEAKSAIILGMNYGPEKNPIKELREKNKAYISIYSRRKDYHKDIKSKLKLLAQSIQENSNAQVKVFVDTAPLMEKPLAQAAGIGWSGKHTNIVSKKFGSWLFLGVILTNIEVKKTKKKKIFCGTCEKCIKACPTGAIVKPFILDARKCISYLTIEHKSNIEKKFRKSIGNRIFGCDDCLAVCPWNKFAKKHQEVKLDFIDKLKLPSLIKLLNFSEIEYKDFFIGTALRRLGYIRFMRNVLIAVANSGDISLVIDVKKKLNNKNELIKAMAVWALFCLNKKDFIIEKEKRYKTETSVLVKKEWMNRES